MTQAAPQPGDTPSPENFGPDPVAAEAPPRRVVAQPPTPAPRLARASNVTVEDNVEFLSGRRIKLTVNGQFFILRAPTHPEYRAYRIEWQRMIADSRKARDEGDAVDQSDEAYNLTLDIIGQFSDTPWDIAPEAEPPWLENIALVGRILNHWVEVPGT